MNEYPDFEQDVFSRTATVINKSGLDSIKLMKWLAFYERSFHESKNYYNLMGSISKYSNETSQR